ncbi:uncharacterized protein si:dkey-32e6.3 [Hemiscyllium ocellatum]|uniref:uncharacterized protein si:dkey-32e6.3 n=1 Tax=Hemiscyllium ocellatum TaxID=170820 RepID=UPI002966DAD9|nr:uncharacterized protein si:dkey-32e6.3 [Hemiscyllium ocellatum]XP_060691106.1 uncharacterized protein si:dkey-32e6.3 [Hemiscyllium ocellatum]XP_060691107.1 uncharacterized protein si:dkey-32e6.3 [Hemiscyllium ocellatum]XP_060691108.1 uncharacterized protein si:dkey-32e6.3 [Hemiscyllium ocellatum]XP_060691109.1 uncharacterized protein si:dkey-32e6.3 [Hemiscyllium ocellatum]
MAEIHPDHDTERVESVSSQMITEIPKTLNCSRSKLIVHLDLNNTVLLFDTITRQGPRRALSSFLTTVTWGRINQEGKWEWLSKVPSLNPPCDGAVSYYSQFGRPLDFTETGDGSLFKKIFTDHLQKVEWMGPHNELLSMTDEDGKEYHRILPSFFELIDCLSSQGREFAIVLRTFGSDLSRTLKTIQITLSGQHPQYQHLQAKHLPLRISPGKIRCNKKNVVLTLGSERISTQSDDRAVYHYFSSLEGIVGFQDHFDWWSRNSFSNEGGKPFWIDPSETGIQHIFIDDNIRLNDAESIVHPQVFMKNGSGTRTVPTSELFDICLVQTDLLRAIHDRSYFIKCVQQCEENYSKYTALSH